jgi:hypothetical protein
MTALISDSHSPQPQFRIIQTGIQSIPASRIDLTEKKYEREKPESSRRLMSDPASLPLTNGKTRSDQRDRSEQHNFRNLPRREPDTRPSRVSSVIHRSQVLEPPQPTELTENMRHYSVPEGHDSTTRYFSDIFTRYVYSET